MLGFPFEDGWATKHRIKSGAPSTRALTEGIVAMVAQPGPYRAVVFGSLHSLCLNDHEAALTPGPGACESGHVRVGEGPDNSHCGVPPAPLSDCFGSERPFRWCLELQWQGTERTPSKSTNQPLPRVHEAQGPACLYPSSIRVKAGPKRRPQITPTSPALAITDSSSLFSHITGF